MLTLPVSRQRYDFDCGPAAVKCVLRYYGLSPKQVEKGLIASRIDGTPPGQLVAFLRDSKLLALSGEMVLDDLRWQTRRGRPVIVMVQRDVEEGDSTRTVGHYVVVAGIAGRRITLMDPADGLVTEPLLSFESRWTEADHWHCFHRFGIAVHC